MNEMVLFLVGERSQAVCQWRRALGARGNDVNLNPNLTQMVSNLRLPLLTEVYRMVNRDNNQCLTDAPDAVTSLLLPL